MILAASLNDQETFDGLWEFTSNALNRNGLPDWEMSPTGQIWGNGSATDADMDIALGLLMAFDVWGSLGYQTAAVQLINNIMDSDVDAATLMLKPGDSWESNCPYNPSYFSPAHMFLFQQVTGDDSWTSVIDNGYTMLYSGCAAEAKADSGLVPDWTNSLTSCTPGTKDVQDMDNGADYYYDALRTPWRLSLHAAWNCDSRALSWTSNMADFFNEAGVYGLDQGFRLDGSSISGDDSRCFISTAATAMIPEQDDDVINVWYEATQSVTSGGGLYFCDTLRMLSLTFQAGLMVQPSV
jgi:endoglucanase